MSSDSPEPIAYASPRTPAHRRARLPHAFVLLAASILTSPLVAFQLLAPYMSLSQLRWSFRLVLPVLGIGVLVLCVASYRGVRRARPHLARTVLFFALMLSSLTACYYIGMWTLRAWRGRL